MFHKNVSVKALGENITGFEAILNPTSDNIIIYCLNQEIVKKDCGISKVYPSTLEKHLK